MAELLFWLSLTFIIFTYLGYPASLWVLQLVSKSPVQKAYWEEWPVVTVVLAAKNEEKSIGKKIFDLMDQDYPEDKLEILVVSDGSTDETKSIVQGIKARNTVKILDLRVVEYKPSAGKATALNIGVAKALGEIIVFADVRQQFSRGAIKDLVSNFTDTNVGCVSGELKFISSEKTGIMLEMGAYWKYEKFIRRMESVSGSVMGATGAIYAIRKCLYKELPSSTLLDDVLTPLNILLQGYRVVFDRSAEALDTISEDIDQEWNRKVRTLAGNWQLVPLIPSLVRHRWFWRFFFHKFARLLVPFLLVSLFWSSLTVDGNVFKLFAIGQFTFYLMALSYLFLSPVRHNPIIKICYFFCIMNLAVAWSFVLWSFGRLDDIWRG